MDERWKSVFGRIEKGPKHTRFTIWVTLKNQLVIYRTIAIPNEEIQRARVDVYKFTLNTLVRDLDDHIKGRAQ